MKLTSRSVVWSVLTVFSFVTIAGCNQPTGGTKKPDAPAQAPANTTDSK